MSRLLATGAYLFVALVACPLLAWNLAVAGAGHGFGWRGFFAVLLGVPAVGAVIGAVVLRRSRRAAAFGATAAVATTVVLLVVLFVLALRTLTF